jgi:hypothetical protein
LNEPLNEPLSERRHLVVCGGACLVWTAAHDTPRTLRPAQEAEASSNGFLSRFLANSMIPTSWEYLLGQVGSEAAAAAEKQQQQQQQPAQQQSQPAAQ